MDSTGPPAAPMALYTNAASPVAKPPSSMPSFPPNGRNVSTGGNWNKYNNKNRNSGNGGDNNGKNSNGSGGHGYSSGQTTARTSSDGRTNAPWPTYDHPWQGQMTMYPAPVPAGQQRLHVFVATPSLYASPASYLGHSSGNSSRYPSRPPRPQDAAPSSTQVGTSSRWPTPSAPWRSTHPLPRSGTGWWTLA
jgi:hypothetical protein